jgi:hypothetical protein
MGRISILCIPLLATLLFNSCEESLPPRDEPIDYFVATCSCNYFRNTFGTVEYIIVSVVVRNMYSETFSATPSILGNVMISWKNDSRYSKHGTFTAGAIVKPVFFDPFTGKNVTTRSEYDPVKNVLTIPVGDSVNFEYTWPFVADDSTDVRRLFFFPPDQPNPETVLSEVETFIVSADVRLYKSTATFHTPTILFTRKYNFNPTIQPPR